jgi:hypothetical protein
MATIHSPPKSSQASKRIIIRILRIEGGKVLEKGAEDTYGSHRDVVVKSLNVYADNFQLDEFFWVAQFPRRGRRDGQARRASMPANL